LKQLQLYGFADGREVWSCREQTTHNFRVARENGRRQTCWKQWATDKLNGAVEVRSEYDAVLTLQEMTSCPEKIVLFSEKLYI
jgi:hypothetical protein